VIFWGDFKKRKGMEKGTRGGLMWAGQRKGKGREGPDFGDQVNSEKCHFIRVPRFLSATTSFAPTLRYFIFVVMTRRRCQMFLSRSDDFWAFVVGAWLSFRLNELATAHTSTGKDREK
jgi:hypothetical protein